MDTVCFCANKNNGMKERGGNVNRADAFCKEAPRAYGFKADAKGDTN